MTYQDFLALFGEQPLLRAAAIVLSALVVGKLLDLIITRAITAWARRTKTDFDDRLIAMLHRPVLLSILFGGLWLAALEAGLDGRPLSLVRSVLLTLMILVWLGFALQLSRLLVELFSTLEERVRIIQPRTVPLFDNVLKLVLAGSAIYFLFLTWGINVGAWLAAAGVVGIAVGFAAKDTLANLFSGIFILADAPYQIGDFIVLDSGERGQVTQIGLRSTRLITRDDIEVTIPNGVIANAKIINESGGPWAMERVRVPVGVAYGSDIDRVRDILMEIADDEPALAADPEPRVRFRAMGESGLNFELLGWIEEPVVRGRVIDALNAAVYKRLLAEGIEIPYPKRDLYVKEWPASPTPPGATP